MKTSKFSLFALLCITLYGGLTQIKIDWQSEIFAGDLSKSFKASNDKLKIVIYVPPEDVGLISHNMDAELWIQNLAGRAVRLDGKVTHISSSSNEPDEIRDFFYYPVLIEAPIIKIDLTLKF
ncbi:MAG: hypothetical protein AAFO95_02640 [Cyanobacteria bacterium J06600_6]